MTISKSDFRIERIRPHHISYKQYEELREAWIFILRVAERSRKMYLPWGDFRVFCYDIGVRPSIDHYFGKFLTCGGYFPKNAGWMTLRERGGFPYTREVHKTIVSSGFLEWEPWEDLYTFVNDVGPRPGLHYRFGKISREEGYHPRNCRWMTQQQKRELGIMDERLTIRNFNGSLLRWSYVLVDYLKEEEYPRVNKTRRGEWGLNPNKPKRMLKK